MMLHAEPDAALAQHTMDTSPTDEEGFVFEGPEKKLEVFFSRAASPEGLRAFAQPLWSELLADAACSILHVESNEHFDAYLLSESSLFVYPYRVILKTCGQTTLLLALPKLLALAAQLGASVDHVHYGHYRLQWPEQQHYPHRSFGQEEAALAELLGGHIGGVHAAVLGDADSGACWYSLCTSRPAGRAALAPPLACSPAEGADDLFEVAMEGLSPRVCAQFVESAHAGFTGKRLAQRMTALSGIGALLPGVTIDDWAFAPCGYSMNGLRGAHYYTVHITPELGFSFASFETNDPAFRQPAAVARVLAVFEPARATATLTTRAEPSHAAGDGDGAAAAGGAPLPVYELAGYVRTCQQAAALGPSVRVAVLGFVAKPAAPAHGAHEPAAPAGPLSSLRRCGSEVSECSTLAAEHGYLSSNDLSSGQMSGPTSSLASMASSSPTSSSPRTSPPASRPASEAGEEPGGVDAGGADGPLEAPPRWESRDATHAAALAERAAAGGRLAPAAGAALAAGLSPAPVR